MSQPSTIPNLPDRYIDQGVFARGGTAAVHQMMDRPLGRPLAMKVLDVSLRDDRETMVRFQREARITAQLDHPSIVPVHDLGPFWFTMKRLEGRTLRALIRNSPYSTALLTDVVDILLKVSDALAFAHEKGVVHCDLKPENIMVGQHGQVYVMDWGIARRIGELDPSAAGTPGWMPPEQAHGHRCDSRSDVYGVGALLYFALCGGRPHEAVDEHARLELARKGIVRPPAEVAPDRRMPPELVRIAMRALHADPASRFPTIAALQQEIRTARDQGWWFELRHYPAGSQIIEEGNSGDAAYLLVDGMCDVQRGGGPIGEILPGEVFGETSLLVDVPRAASVFAVTDVHVRVISRQALDEELARSPWMAALVRTLARRFHALLTESQDPWSQPIPHDGDEAP